MRRIGIDFGTGNTVISVWNENHGRAETIRIPEISTSLRYRLMADGREQEAHVIPSLIHYSPTEVLIGDQVLSRGLADHRDTVRWMKRAIGAGSSKRVRTAQGFKSPAEAAGDFLTLAIRYAADHIRVEEDDFTFTAPCEAFENYQDWLRGVAETLGMRRVQFLDEPTACVTGNLGAVRRDEVFAVFDFGCGTLDMSVVRIDAAAVGDRKAVQIGQAGDDLGGMDIDHALLEDFSARHGLDTATLTDLRSVILRRAEEVKIALSDPKEEEADLLVLNDRGYVPRPLRTTYSRECEGCRKGKPGRHSEPELGCLGCLMLDGEMRFLHRAGEVVDRALENAAIKGGVRKASLSRVLVTGGTSLMPAVREMLDRTFPSIVQYDHPFDAVACGACQGLVDCVLTHDYAIESYRSVQREYEFIPLFETGTEYPTKHEVAFWATVAFDGQTRMAPKIFELSRMMRREKLNGVIFDERGAVMKEAESRVKTEFRNQCINDRDLTYIVPDPPAMKERDKRRFRLRFKVDGQRRLLLTVEDHHPAVGREILTDHPVVRL